VSQPFWVNTEEQSLSKKIKKTNPRIIQLISDLKAVSREGGVHIWRDIARRLERPTRQYPQVNLGKINRYTNTDDTVIIPGKVLGAGNIKHKVTVAALNFSDTAVEKITNSGGLCLKIEDLLTENPSGSAVKIIQ
jgi:large subunit ribosomal protein L18e